VTEEECCPREALRLSTNNAHARMGGMGASTKSYCQGRLDRVMLRVVSQRWLGTLVVCRNRDRTLVLIGQRWLAGYLDGMPQSRSEFGPFEDHSDRSEHKCVRRARDGWVPWWYAAIEIMVLIASGEVRDIVRPGDDSV